MAVVDLSRFNQDVLRAAGVTAKDVLGAVDIWIPAEACKAGAAKAETDLLVEGFASTDHKDFEGENTDQDGLLWEYHLKHGWLTDGHDKTAKSGLGHPIEATKITLPDGHKATKYRAFLLDTPDNRTLHQRVAAASRLKRSRYGFSIQGPVLGRAGPDGKTLAKVLVTDVAFTRHPVNPYSTMSAVAKSLDAASKGLGWVLPGVHQTAKEALLDMALKTLDAGHPDPHYPPGSGGDRLVRQSHNGRSKMRKIKKAAFKAQFPDLSDDRLAEVAKAADVELEDDDDRADDDGSTDMDAAEKCGVAKKAMDAALEEIRDHMEKGGKVILDDGEPEVQADPTGVLRNLVEATKDLQVGDESTAKGIMALMTLVAAQGEALGETRKAIDEANAMLAVIADKPAVPRAVRNGVALPGRNAGDQREGTLRVDEARKALTTALTNESMKRDRSPARITQIGEMLTGVEARTIQVTAKDLEAIGVAI